MLLKKFFIGLMFLFSSSIVNAQIHGLSIADLADPAGKGTKQLTAFAFTSKNSDSFGARFAYGISDRILLFMDLGKFDHEKSDPETMGQFGVRYSLPLELPFDLSIRSTLIPYKKDFEHYIDATLSLFASRYLDSKSKWAAYGGFGINYQEWELEMALDPMQAAYLGYDTYVDIGDRNDLLYCLGMSFEIKSSARLFIETVYFDQIDDSDSESYSSMGLRFEL